MCVADLDLDLDLETEEIGEIEEIAEDQEAPGPGRQGPGPQPIGGQAPGVAWGRAEQHPAARSS
jgi:hypothetical protein